MCWKIDYRDVALNAVDVVKIWDNDKKNSTMTRYTNEDIKVLVSCREKIERKIESLEKYGIDWIDSYQLKRWSRKMKKILDRVHDTKTL
jgi:aryl-alcohol dehydrogenase-like predicted oxidoreductase